jgi:Na+-transporting methylmalonyl-CoA/oxaloacetate decarboxylase beta subunit
MEHDDSTAPDSADGFFTSVFVKAIMVTIGSVSAPPIALMGVGAVADFYLDTKPMICLIGAVVGFAVAALLVARQIKKLKAEQK